VDGYARAVPQRRKRVMLVGHIGSWRRAAEVLLVGEGVSGHPPPRRAQGQEAAGDAEGGAGTASGKDGDAMQPLVMSTGQANAEITRDYSPTILGASCERPIVCMGNDHANAEIRRGISATVKSNQPPIVCHGSQDPIVAEDVAHCAGRNNGRDSVMFYDANKGKAIDVGMTVVGDHESRVTNETHVVCKTDVRSKNMLRRLTPLEVERLFGFPDNYTQIPWKGKPAEECPDTPRYKSCGNSWAVNCARWVMRRIDIVERIYREREQKHD